MLSESLDQGTGGVDFSEAYGVKPDEGLEGMVGANVAHTLSKASCVLSVSNGLVDEHRQEQNGEKDVKQVKQHLGIFSAAFFIFFS